MKAPLPAVVHAVSPPRPPAGIRSGPFSHRRWILALNEKNIILQL